jgi:phosphatidylinositol alpha-mannosyltransferase
MLTRAVAAAAECTVGSAAAAAPFRRYLLREPRVIHPGVAVGEFATATSRAPGPTLVCAASLGDPRKRARLLFEAFVRLRRDRPDARLLVFEDRDPVMSRDRAALPAGAELLEARSEPAGLAAAYAASWASVLPAVEEAFGLVLVESLAAGTPFVADRSGAGPEILAGDEGVGRLFDSDDPADLARAMAEALELGADPASAERCRARAANFDWDRLVGEWVSLYERAAGAG